MRTQTSSRVSIRNPTDADIVLKASASHKQLIVPATITLPARGSVDVEVKFRPLVVGPAEASLKLECTELGLFEWTLKLAGLPTAPERPLAFSCALGSKETQAFRFTHWLEDKADYKVAFKSSGTAVASGGAFSAQATLSAPAAPPGPAAGVEVSVDVSFEPTALGEAIRDTLLLTSTTGGEYAVPLLGQCVPPKPQGPVDVSKGSAAVPFTNVFSTDAEFLYSVDNAAFQVKPNEKIGAKKPTNVAVAFKIDPKVFPDASKVPRTAKLTISCPSQTQCQWVYYLQA